jgi:hypothetical protein
MQFFEAFNLTIFILLCGGIFNKDMRMLTKQEDIQMPEFFSNCFEYNCQYCDINDNTICNKCFTGFYLHNGKCVDRCPKQYLADTITYTCVHYKTGGVNYLMKYSIGSCLNICGYKSTDCSCSKNCKQTGTCCTDYILHNCGRVFEKGLKVKQECIKTEGCELCDDVSLNEDNLYLCNQCLPAYKYYNNKCFKECPENTYEDTTIHQCFEKTGILYLNKIALLTVV